MATFWKKVFISAAAALFTGGSTGLKAAEGAGPSGVVPEQELAPWLEALQEAYQW